MKKILALTLAVLMAVSMFAACDSGAGATPTDAPATPTDAPATEPPATEPPATEPPATEPPATEPPATEPPADEKYVTIGKLSKHENGWVQNNWGNDSYGVFFSAVTNDAPFNDGENYVYYRPVDSGVIKLIRDGETIELGDPLVDFLNKESRNAYYLRLEEWMVEEYFPITNGDVILVEGDFYNEENGYTIHFDPVYMVFNGDMVKFSTTDPNAA